VTRPHSTSLKPCSCDVRGLAPWGLTNGHASRNWSGRVFAVEHDVGIKPCGTRARTKLSCARQNALLPVGGKSTAAHVPTRPGSSDIATRAFLVEHRALFACMFSTSLFPYQLGLVRSLFLNCCASPFRLTCGRRSCQAALVHNHGFTFGHKAKISGTRA
jgi:hypothetical protein